MSTTKRHSQFDSIHKGAFIQSGDPAVDVPTQMAVKVLWIDTSSAPYALKRRNDTNDGWDNLGLIFDLEGLQDAVGAMLADSSHLDFSYNDGAGTFTASIKPDSVTETEMATAYKRA